MNFSLFEISTYGWKGFSICSFETDWYHINLLHIEKTNGVWKIEILFGFINYTS